MKAQTPLSQKFLASEFWIVGALAVGSLLWNPLLWGVILAELAFWVVRRISRGKFTRRTPADWPIAGLLGMLGVSFWVSPVFERSQEQALRLVAGLALFYAVVNWIDTSRKLRWLNIGILLAGLGLALSAGLIVNWATEKVALPGFLYENFVVAVQDDVNPNVLAGSLVLILPFSLAAVWLGGKSTLWPEKLLAGVCGLAMLGALLLTQARGAWIAAALSLLLVFALRWRWGVPVLAAGLAIGFVILMISRQAQPSAMLLGGLQGVVNSRMDIWARGVFLLNQFPLSGIGMGTFSDLTSLYYPFPANPAQATSIPHTHNLFLQVGLDLGIPGLVSWLAVWLVTWAAGWNVYRFGQRSSQSLFILLGAGVLGSQLALSVHGITDAVTWGMVRSAPLVWVLWGIASGAFLLSYTRQPGKKTDPPDQSSTIIQT